MCVRLTLQLPGRCGFGGFGSSAALVSDLLDVQDEHVGAVLPALGHSVEVGGIHVLEDGILGKQLLIHNISCYQLLAPLAGEHMTPLPVKEDLLCGVFVLLSVFVCCRFLLICRLKVDPV